jgi:hypothetical protein
MLLDGRVLGIAMRVLASLSWLPILLPKWSVEYRRHQQHTEIWHNPSQWVKKVRRVEPSSKRMNRIYTSDAAEYTLATPS